MSPEKATPFERWILGKIFKTPIGKGPRETEGASRGSKSAAERSADQLELSETRELAAQREDRLDSETGERGGRDDGGEGEGE